MTTFIEARIVNHMVNEYIKSKYGSKHNPTDVGIKWTAYIITAGYIQASEVVAQINGVHRK